MTKLDRLFLRLEKDGFVVRKSELCNIDCTGINAPVLIIDTNYEGIYPPKSVFDKLGMIRNICKNRFSVQARGYYTAVFIRKWLPDEKHL